MVDVTNVPSSSTSMSFLPMTQATAKVTRPKVVTQEPTMGKTSPTKEDTQVGKETDTQEPTSTMEVKPQEPVFPHDGARIEEHAKSDIIKGTTTMLKDLAQTVITTRSQVKISPTITMSATRYATWIFNALP